MNFWKAATIIFGMSENIESALYLIPVTLGDTSYERVLPEYNREIISQIKIFVVESKRSAIRFLKSIIVASIRRSNVNS